MKKSGILQGLKNYIIAILLSVMAAGAVFYIVFQSGVYLQGSAVYAQLYKLDVIAESAKNGIWWPLYAKHWYNGYEIFRYSFPLSYIIIHGFTILFKIDIHAGIALFYGCMVFVSMMGFFLFGIKMQKMPAAFITGVAFWLMPTTIYTAVEQSCFDVLMSLALLPLLLFFMFDFIRWKSRKSLLPYTVVFGLLILSHYILGIVTGIMILLYLVLRIITTKAWRFEMALAGDSLLTYLVMGYVLFPALVGGLLTREYSLQADGGLKVGAAMIVIAVLGLFVSDRMRAAGFLFSVIVLVLSMDMFEPVLRLMPYKALQNPHWFLLVGVVFFLVTLLCWERLRLVFLVLFLGVIIGENVPRMQLLKSGDDALKNCSEMIESCLLDDAAALTENRLALIDDTLLGDFPHWYLMAQDVDTMFGWDYENALTVHNQFGINEAFADGFYDYMFERLLLYGSDVVVILKELFTEPGAYEVLLADAADNRYSVVKENENVIILKADGVSGNYGVISDYENLAIGKDASVIAYIYPSFGLGRSSCLEDYTVGELEQYKKLFLSGFEYREKEKAENMLRELAEKGVEIYIDMQHIPINALTGKNEFMGIYAQFVQFTEDFPILENDNGNQFKLDFKTEGYEVWNTVYVSGCTEIEKETTYEGKKHLTYIGKGKESNITYMGFNLVYYYLSTHNRDLKRFLDETMGLSEEMPENIEIVPIEVERYPTQIVVHSPMDGVNCNIANADALIPDRIISTEENMWVVNRGDTVFQIERPKRLEGIVVSIFGGICMMLLWIMVYVVLEIPVREQEEG